MPANASTKPTARVILGVINFGPETETGARVTSLDDYNSILDHFQACGHNEIDTARVYMGGKQEAFTRSVKASARGISIATKWYPYLPGAHSAAKLEEALETSLQELGTDTVDTFYLHAPDRSIPFQEPLETLDKLHKQGKFHNLGLSNFTAYEVAEIVMLCKANNWIRPTIFQCMYNVITRHIDPELVAACRRYELDIVVYNPLAGGVLSGRYTSAAEIPKEGRFAKSNGLHGEMIRKRYFKDTNFEALSILEPVVRKFGLTLVEVALRWLVHHSALNVLDGNDGVIVGVSSLEQLKQNLTDLEKGQLPEEVVTALDEAWLVAKATAPVYWLGELKYEYDTKAALA